MASSHNQVVWNLQLVARLVGQGQGGEPYAGREGLLAVRRGPYHLHTGTLPDKISCLTSWNVSTNSMNFCRNLGAVTRCPLQHWGEEGRGGGRICLLKVTSSYFHMRGSCKYLQKSIFLYAAWQGDGDLWGPATAVSSSETRSPILVCEMMRSDSGAKPYLGDIDGIVVHPPQAEAEHKVGQHHAGHEGCRYMHPVVFPRLATPAMIIIDSLPNSHCLLRKWYRYRKAFKINPPHSWLLLRTMLVLCNKGGRLTETSLAHQQGGRVFRRIPNACNLR